jgi:hypothetical protein
MMNSLSVCFCSTLWSKNSSGPLPTHEPHFKRRLMIRESNTSAHCRTVPRCLSRSIQLTSCCPTRSPWLLITARTKYWIFSGPKTLLFFAPQIVDSTHPIFVNFVAQKSHVCGQSSQRQLGGESSGVACRRCGRSHKVPNLMQVAQRKKK